MNNYDFALQFRSSAPTSEILDWCNQAQERLKAQYLYTKHLENELDKTQDHVNELLVQVHHKFGKIGAQS